MSESNNSLLSYSSTDKLSVYERNSAIKLVTGISTMETQYNHLDEIRTGSNETNFVPKHHYPQTATVDALVAIDNKTTQDVLNLNDGNTARSLEINQKIFLPHDYDPSQIVKIKIIVPKKVAEKTAHGVNFCNINTGSKKSDESTTVGNHSREYFIKINNTNLDGDSHLNLFHQIEATLPECEKSHPIKVNVARQTNRSTSEEYIKSNKNAGVDSRRFTIPIMGRNALMLRSHYFKSDAPDTEESKIVQELVLERYKEILNNVSKKRCNFRRFSGYKSEEDYKNLNSDWRDSGNISIQNEILLGETFTKSNSLSRSIERSPTLSNDDFGDTFSLGALSSLDDGLPDNAQEVEYDSRLFLKVALGDEISSCCSDLNSSVSSRLSDTKSQYIDTNYIETPDTSRRTSAHSLHASVHKKSKELICEQHQTSCEYQSMPGSHSPMENASNKISHPSPELETLMHEFNAQQEIILQVSKALRFCMQNKKFMGSFEQMEAERVLLIACERKKALQNELEKIEYEEIKNSNSIGLVKISKLCFSLKQSPSVTKEAVIQNQSIHYYICLIRCGPVVLASDTAIPNGSGNICFHKTFNVERLLPDFEIIISIYCMEVPKKDSVTSCPKFRIFNTKKKMREDQHFVQNSSFISHGKHSIRISNLTKSEFKIFDLHSSSQLKGLFTGDIHTEVEMSNSKEGFLTIGEEVNNGIMWNRLWCRILGPEFSCYYYPEESTPYKTIDITCSVNQEIHLVDRSLCPRPRTLLLEVGPNSDNVEFHVSKLYLSADNSADLQSWASQLNNVLTSLIQWNCMKDYFYNS